MSALSEVCEEVTRLQGTPHVVTARSVQHLETPVSARMCEVGALSIWSSACIQHRRSAAT